MKGTSFKAICLAGAGIFAWVFMLSCSPADVKESREKARLERPSDPSARKAFEAPHPCPASGQTQETAGITEARLVSLELDPPRPVTGDTLRAVVGLEGANVDDEEALHVRWNINGKDMEKTGVVLEHPVRYGDSVTATAELISSDGRRQVLSTSVLVENAPPMIGLLKETVDGGEYVAVIQTEDPEEDEVILKLVEAPEGMILDEGAKTLRWRPSSAQNGGMFHVVLEGKDSPGNVSRLSFDVTVSDAGEKELFAGGQGQ